VLQHDAPAQPLVCNVLTGVRVGLLLACLLHQVAMGLFLLVDQ
jgi:hypothetical protein